MLAWTFYTVNFESDVLSETFLRQQADREEWKQKNNK